MSAASPWQLLHPLVLLPVQVPTRSRSGRSPALRLMLAVVEDAIACLRNGAGHDAHEYREAYRWLFDNDRDWPFSFLNLCDWLGLDASAVRRSIGLTKDDTELVEILFESELDTGAYFDQIGART